MSGFNTMPAKLKTFRSNRAAIVLPCFFASAIVINARADAGFDVGFDFHKITSLCPLQVKALQKSKNTPRRETPKAPRFAEKISATLGGFGEVRRIDLFLFWYGSRKD